MYCINMDGAQYAFLMNFTVFSVYKNIACAKHHFEIFLVLSCESIAHIAHSYSRHTDTIRWCIGIWRYRRTFYKLLAKLIKWFMTWKTYANKPSSYNYYIVWPLWNLFTQKLFHFSPLPPTPFIPTNLTAIPK